MTTENKPQPPIDVNTDPHESRKIVQLTFTVAGESAWTINASAADVDRLISKLDVSRQILEPIVDATPRGDSKYNVDVFNPRWAIAPDSENRFAVLWIRHPGLGWKLFGFPRHEAADISRWLRKIPVFKNEEERRKAFPQEATSFGDDKFLMTTHGLGFYYFGEGDGRIGLNPFDQVEFDSDRAAGIVAGSIVERRLESAIKSLLRKDEQDFMKTVSNTLFQFSGPLGSFQSKIHLAFALNILSVAAYRDLNTLKGIRNDFAHQLELDSFDAPTIRDRCKLFTFVDLHIGPVPPQQEEKDRIENITESSRPSPYLGYPDHAEKLDNPRFRYVMTAQLFSYQLGVGAQSKEPKLPML